MSNHAVRPRGAAILAELRSCGQALLRRRLFTIATASVLALGIGAAAGIGGVGWAALAAPLPYPEADRLVQVFHDDDLTFGVSLNELVRYQDESRTLSGVAGWVVGGATLAEDRGAERVVVARVTPDLYGVLGRGPILGRGFSPEAAGSEVVLTDRFWRTRMGADPAVLGATLRLDETNYRVVGVLPPRVVFPDPSVDLHLAVPMERAAGVGRGGIFLDVIARLGAGSSLEAAGAEVDAIARALRRMDPGAYEGEPDFGGHVASFRELHNREERPLLMALGAGAAALLLATCINVAFLLRARGRRREGEMRIRRVLGASSAALARLRAMEGLLLVALGATAGSVVALGVASGVSGLVPDALPLAGRSPAAAVLTALPVIAVGAGLALCAFVLTGGATGGAMSGTRVTARLGILRHALPAAQVALALMLVTGSALLLRTVRDLASTDLGYRLERTLSARISLPPSRYASDAHQAAFFGALETRLSSLPGVREVGLVNSLPLSGYGGSGDLRIQGIASDSAVDVAMQRIVSPGYLNAAGIPLLAGRPFTASDRAGSPRVALVDQVLARRFFGSADAALGRRIRFFMGGEDWNEIVGVVGHVRHGGPTAMEEPQVYVPAAQRPTRSAHMVVHHAGPIAPVATALRAVLRDLDPTIALYDMASMEERLRGILRRERVALALFTGFGALALLLAVIGTYAVVALAQQRRVREIGVRRALGAPAMAIARAIASDGLLGVSAGLALGAVGALAMAGVLGRFLVTSQGADGAAFAMSATLLLSACLLATLVPVGRALAVDPAEVMRDE